MSRLSGDQQLTKFPAEKFYPAVDGTHDWLAEDMKATAAEVFEGEPVRVWARPNAATAADVRAKRPPRYQIFYEYEKDGQPVVDMVPGLWAGDMDVARQRAAEARDDAFRAAEEERARLSQPMEAQRRREMRADPAEPVTLGDILPAPSMPELISPDEQRTVIRERLGIGGSSEQAEPAIPGARGRKLRRDRRDNR